MINKSFDDIDEIDINYLIDNEVPESRTIDYKQDLQLKNDPDKKEFLYDVSSFANASGGDIIYGISEKRDEDNNATGIPESANGISENGKAINHEDVIQKMENLMRDCIEPRIFYRIRHIEGFQCGPIILLRITKSWMPPHMVTFKGSQRFYTRKERKRYPLDIIEIRNAVLLSESIADKIRRFRDGRLARIISNETPTILSKSARIVMHIFPISGLDLTKQINIKSINSRDLMPLGGGGVWTTRYNFDGILTAVCTHREDCENYLQLFRNGAIETVNTSSLKETIENFDQLIHQNIYIV